MEMTGNSLPRSGPKGCSTQKVPVNLSLLAASRLNDRAGWQSPGRRPCPPAPLPRHETRARTIPVRGRGASSFIPPERANSRLRHGKKHALRTVPTWAHAKIAPSPKSFLRCPQPQSTAGLRLSRVRSGLSRVRSGAAAGSCCAAFSVPAAGTDAAPPAVRTSGSCCRRAARGFPGCRAQPPEVLDSFQAIASSGRLRSQ
jgi:hypothetical protein